MTRGINRAQSALHSQQAMARFHTPTQEQRSRLANALAEWLEAERAAFAATWADDDGLISIERPLAVRYYERVAEREARWYWEVKTEALKISRFAFGPGLSLLVKCAIRPPLEQMLELYGPDCVDGALIDDKDQGPAGRYSPFFGRLCGDYISKLPMVTQPAPDIAASVIDNYLDFLQDDEIVQVVELVIGGIHPPDTPVEWPDNGISLRALTPAELGELNKNNFGFFSMVQPSVLPAAMSISKHNGGLESSMLSVRQVQPRKGQPPKSFRMHRLVFALQLLGYPICSRGAIAAWDEPGPKVPNFPRELVLPRLPNGPEVPFHPDDMRRAAAIAERVPDGVFDEPSGREEIALHRFCNAAAQDDDSEALIDYVIALEGLLVPNAQTEVGFRLCINGAHFIADEARERPRLFADLKKLYDTRSKLVHGAGATAVNWDLKQQARSVAARGFIKALTRGWPSAADFVTLILKEDANADRHARPSE